MSSLKSTQLAPSAGDDSDDQDEGILSESILHWNKRIGSDRIALLSGLKSVSPSMSALAFRAGAVASIEFPGNERGGEVVATLSVASEAALMAIAAATFSEMRTDSSNSRVFIARLVAKIAPDIASSIMTRANDEAKAAAVSGEASGAGIWGSSAVGLCRWVSSAAALAASADGADLHAEALQAVSACLALLGKNLDFAADLASEFKSPAAAQYVGYCAGSAIALIGAHEALNQAGSATSGGPDRRAVESIQAAGAALKRHPVIGSVPSILAVVSALSE